MQYLGFVNLTPFAAQPFLLSDERGADLLTCVVKATFTFRASQHGTSLAVAEEQTPVCLAPEHYGDPAQSSLKFDSESAPVKLGTDIVLIGHAVALGGPATYLDVSIAVGPARYIVRVFGNRAWTKGVSGWIPSAPEPFEMMPLIYERAFGGWDRTSSDPSQHDFEPRNPVGVGFISKRHGLVQEGTPLPNLENPYEPIQAPTDRPAPVGFGYIGGHWQPRARYAGTYDERWQKQRMPLLPDDFDRRYYNAAHPALALQGFLRGGESVEVLNSSLGGSLRFALPQPQPFGTVRMRNGETQRLGMALDTIIVDTDTNRLLLLWRGSLSIQKRAHDIVWSKVQLASSASALT